MSIDASKPKTVSINLNPAARAVIEALRDETGVPNTDAMIRILEWFAAQPTEVRLAILTRQDANALITRHRMEEMSERGAALDVTVKLSAAEALKMAHRMIERAELELATRSRGKSK